MEVLRVDVDIDIKPGSNLNSINLRSRGVIPVALLGSDSFDVTEVDVTALEFGLDGATPEHDLTDPSVLAGHLQDVNGDGFTDLVSHYRTQAADIQAGDTEACLGGMLLSGLSFTGCDSVRTLSSPPDNASESSISLLIVTIEELEGGLLDPVTLAETDANELLATPEEHSTSVAEDILLASASEWAAMGSRETLYAGLVDRALEEEDVVDEWPLTDPTLSLVIDALAPTLDAQRHQSAWWMAPFVDFHGKIGQPRPSSDAGHGATGTKQ